MKRLSTYGSLAAFVAAAVIILASVPATCQEDAQTPLSSIVLAGGVSMLSDMHLYGQVAVVDPDLGDITVALGLNNGVWAGAHGYIFPADQVAGFVGIELQPVRDTEGVVSLSPALGIGVVIRPPGTYISFGARILPVAPDTEPLVKFGISALFTFGGPRE